MLKATCRTSTISPDPWSLFNIHETGRRSSSNDLRGMLHPKKPSSSLRFSIPDIHPRHNALRLCCSTERHGISLYMSVRVDDEPSTRYLPVSSRHESPQALIRPVGATVHRTLATLVHRYSPHLVLASFAFPAQICQRIPAVFLIGRIRMH